MVHATSAVALVVHVVGCGCGHVGGCLISVELIIVVGGLITGVAIVEILLEVSLVGTHLLSVVLEALVLVAHGPTTTSVATASSVVVEVEVGVGGVGVVVGLNFFEF